MNCLFWPPASKDEILSLADVQIASVSFETSQSQSPNVQHFYTGAASKNASWGGCVKLWQCHNAISTNQLLFHFIMQNQIWLHGGIMCFLPQIYWKLLPQLAHTRQVDLTLSVSVFNRSIDFYLLNMSSSLSHFRPRVCIGRTSGLVCDGVSDCIFGEDEDPQLCQTSSSHKAVPERK